MSWWDADVISDTQCYLRAGIHLWSMSIEDRSRWTQFLDGRHSQVPGALRKLRVRVLRIRMRRKLQAVMANGDRQEIFRLVADSVGKILRAGLTSQEMSVLKHIYNTQGDNVKERLRIAFSIGWTKNRDGSFSDAADEVLREAKDIINEQYASRTYRRE